MYNTKIRVKGVPLTERRRDLDIKDTIKRAQGNVI
jgi:hypothetical protein